MSVLFPLYALAAAAIVGPILFHLFQRQPHGLQEFSSLMFLKPTPPKLARRSRLSDLLLLLMRGLALLLLAAAFARPFLRSASLLDLDAPSRSVALMVDTSASLRRADLWDQLQESVNDVLDELHATDRVMLLRYDKDVETLVSFESWETTDPARRIALLREQASSLQPSWNRTDLSAAAITASDALLQQRIGDNQHQPLHVIAFTDLQAGSDLQGLQSYEWPEDISVEVRSVQVKGKTNASFQALPPDASETDASQVRVLVRNEDGGEHGQFQLQWASEALKPIDVYVPPGQTRVVRVTQPKGALQLELSGDDDPFDNQLYLTETIQQYRELWYIGEEAQTAKQDLFFYLEQSALDTRTRTVAVKQISDYAALATAMPMQVPLIVVAQPLTGAPLDDLRRYVERGGRLLVALPGPHDASVGVHNLDANEVENFLIRLFGLTDLEVTPTSADKQYSMLANIDFQHPLFAPFADPRFSNFTKINFWTHWEMTTSDPDAWAVLARFEGGAPALTEARLGDGVAWVLPTSWRPHDSQLALSSKFMPLLHGFLGQTERAEKLASYEVGTPIEFRNSKQATQVVGPGGETYTIAAGETFFGDNREPGIYTFRQTDRQFKVAVNLAPSESHTKPLLPDRLEQLGLHLGEQQSVETLQKVQRQMRNKELEGRQKLWRWGIVAALAFVGLETLFSARSVVPPVG